MSVKNVNLSFLIVGAAKSGTTFLANYLNKHPDIFLPTGELRFFSNVHSIKGIMSDFFIRTFIREIGDYNHLFLSTKKPILGEKSPCYLYYYEESIKNIKKHFGSDIKIIILLRNPVERAFSQYKHSLKFGYESISFQESLHLEKQRKEDNWYYIFLHKEVGLYSESVKAYIENFKNIKIYTAEDLKNNQDAVIGDIYNFLGAKPFQVDTTHIEKNEGNVYKNNLDKLIFQGSNEIDNIYTLFEMYINKYKKVIPEKILNFILKKDLFIDFIDTYKKNKKKEDIKMDQDVKRQLQDFYYEDIKKTEKLLNRDLSSWLQ